MSVRMNEAHGREKSLQRQEVFVKKVEDIDIGLFIIGKGLNCPGEMVEAPFQVKVTVVLGGDKESAGSEMNLAARKTVEN